MFLNLLYKIFYPMSKLGTRKCNEGDTGYSQ